MYSVVSQLWKGKIAIIANYASSYMLREVWSGKKNDIPLSVYARPNESQEKEISFLTDSFVLFLWLHECDPAAGYWGMARNG